MSREVVLALCLVAVSSSVDASKVNIRSAKVTMVSSVAARAACVTVETACTRFDAVELYCDCALKGGDWAPRVRIDVQPRMYVTSIDYVVHEFSHLFDFRNVMTRHADEIESHSFPTLSACEGFIGATRQKFPDALSSFRRESMKLRDHEQASGR
jgi:hypothetical protein